MSEFVLVTVPVGHTPSSPLHEYGAPLCDREASSASSMSRRWPSPWPSSSECQCCVVQVSAAPSPSLAPMQQPDNGQSVNQPNNQYVTGTGQVGAVVPCSSAQLFRHTLHPPFGCYTDKAYAGVLHCW